MNEADEDGIDSDDRHYQKPNREESRKDREQPIRINEEHRHKSATGRAHSEEPDVDDREEPNRQGWKVSRIVRICLMCGLMVNCRRRDQTFRETSR